MKAKRKIVGLLFGIVAGIGLWLAPLSNLEPDGHHCLALTVCAIVWWAFEVVPVGFSSCALLLGYVLVLDSALVPAATIFKLWTMPMAYLIIGGFLIAAAIRNSGVGRRIAFFCVGCFVHSYRLTIIACYFLSFALSLIIPQSFPRALLIMSVMSTVIEKSGMEKEAAANVGLAVFASQISAGMFLLTSESMMNFALLAQLPPESRPTWLSWFAAMSLPAVLLGAVMCAVQLKLFPEAKTFHFTAEQAREELEKMGPVNGAEKRTIFWLATAVLLWMTDQIHGVDLGWIGLGIAVIMSLPVVGDVITAKDWSDINLGTLMFLTACVAIGGVGSATGMNHYLADLLLPDHPEGGLLKCVLIIVAVCVALHLALGSILATLALVTSAVLTFAETMGVGTLIAAFTLFMVAAGQWIFPFQNLNVTIGIGDGLGSYNSERSIRFGLACTIPALICVFISVGWWKLIGLV